MPGKKQSVERRENITRLLALLRAKGPMNRRALASALNLSWGCISQLCALLLEEGLLQETSGQAEGTRGRTPSILSLNPEICFLGVDVNRMGLTGAVCTLCGGKIADYSAEMRCRSREELIESVLALIGRVRSRHERLAGVGLAMQGLYHAGEEAWLFPGLDGPGISWQRELSKRLELPVLVEHDPACILYGSMGADTSLSRMVLRMDHGFGATLYRDHRLIRENPMEMGYLSIDSQGRRLHDVASLSAIEKAVPLPKDAEMLTPEQRQAFEEAASHIGRALGNVSHLMAPDEILLCGEMIRYYDCFGAALNRAYQQAAAPRQAARLTPVFVTDAALGAARMIMEAYEWRKNG